MLPRVTLATRDMGLAIGCAPIRGLGREKRIRRSWTVRCASRSSSCSTKDIVTPVVAGRKARSEKKHSQGPDQAAKERVGKRLNRSRSGPGRTFTGRLAKDVHASTGMYMLALSDQKLCRWSKYHPSNQALVLVIGDDCL